MSRWSFYSIYNISQPQFDTDIPSLRGLDNFASYQKNTDSIQIFRLFRCFLKKKGFNLIGGNQPEPIHYQALRRWQIEDGFWYPI